jgi:hypothetical protein
MFLTQHTASAFKRFAEQRLGLDVTTEVQVQLTQIMHRAQRNWILISVKAAHHLDRFGPQCSRFVNPALPKIQKSQVGKELYRGRMLLTQRFSALPVTLGKKLLSLIELALPAIEPTERTHRNKCFRMLFAQHFASALKGLGQKSLRILIALLVYI